METLSLKVLSMLEESDKPPFLLLMNVMAGPSIDACVIGKSKADFIIPYRSQYIKQSCRR